MRFPRVIITNRARDRPRYFRLSTCRETLTFVNNVLNHDFMLVVFISCTTIGKTTVNRKDYNDQ